MSETPRTNALKVIVNLDVNDQFHVQGYINTLETELSEANEMNEALESGKESSMRLAEKRLGDIEKLKHAFKEIGKRPDLCVDDFPCVGELAYHHANKENKRLREALGRIELGTKGREDWLHHETMNEIAKRALDKE